MQFTSDIVIGLEIHIQLDTESKLFCSCPTKPKKTGIKLSGSEEEKPNTRCCVTCLGMPGSKPVLNKKAVDYALKLCLALGCKISDSLIFSRKSYFYPDLAKNYQITQYEIPLGEKGHLALSDESGGKKITIRRIHIEEDPASLVHQGNIEESPFVLIDYNRSGIPLCEIVTEPDMTSPEEARDFMKQLRTILFYLGIFDPETCIVKADANVSIKETGYVRSEIKNITGFKEIENALFYEVARHQKAFSNNEAIRLETRGWDPQKGITYRMRAKETEEDYGYILDTDLPAVDITKEWIEETKKSLPELPEQKVEKFVKQYKIPKEDAIVLAQEKSLAEMFEKVAGKTNPGLAAKWIKRELVRVMNYNKMAFDVLPISEVHLTELLELVHKKEITERVGQKIIEQLAVKPFSPKEYVKKQGLSAVSDSSLLEKYCKEAVSENPKVADDYKKGNEKSLHYLVGQVMKKSGGKAVPQKVSEIIKNMLS